MPNPLRIALGLLVLAGLFWILESLWPEDRQQPKWRHDSWTDVAYFVGVTGVLGRLVGSVLAISGIAFTALTLHRSGPTPLSAQPAWLQTVEVVAIGALVDYWSHRLFHQLPALWRVHAIHHSPEKIDWLASARVHPFDGAIQKVAGPAIVAALGFSPHLVAGQAAFLAIYPIYLHANVSWGYGPLRWLVASPAFHRWHHASDEAALDKNFSGAFPFVDALFGTAYFPKGKHPERYGLYREQIPTSILGQLAYPFRDHADRSWQIR